MQRGRKPVKRGQLARPAIGLSPAQRMHQRVNEAWEKIPNGRGKHAKVVKALRDQGFEVKESVRGIDVGRPGGRLHFFR